MTDSSMNSHDSAAYTPPRILCIGMPVRDLTFNVQAVPGRGQKFNADRFAQICGGNALNAAIGISRPIRTANPRATISCDPAWAHRACAGAAG